MCCQHWETAHGFIESLHEGVDLSANVSRARIDMLVTQLLPSFMEPIDDVLAQAGLTAADINKVLSCINLILRILSYNFDMYTQVIVCGGTSKMPRIQQAIKEKLPNTKLLSQLTADEVISVGCSQQAALMAKPWDETCQHVQVQVPTISKTISIKVKNINYLTIIESS